MRERVTRLAEDEEYQPWEGKLVWTEFGSHFPLKRFYIRPQDRETVLEQVQRVGGARALKAWED